MGLADLFNWSNRSDSSNELPSIYTFGMSEQDFVSTDLINMYSRILTDVLERTSEVPEDVQPLLWDNCIASESKDGLVTLLAKAMTCKDDLFLVYDKATKVIRKADQAEQAKIRDDYKEKGESSVGYFISFKNYNRSDMLKIYSVLEYCTVASLSQNMNLSKAIQFKMSKLRESTGAVDSAQVKSQALSITNGLKEGKNVLMDGDDTIETGKPDLTATQASMEFIVEKRSFYLGLPATYITGIAPKGLGDSGEGDAKATERGLKGYYYSIIKPTLEVIFKIKTTFKSEDFTGLSTALETLRTFELTSYELISKENKLKFINKQFGLPDSAKGDEVKTPDPKVDPKTGQPVVTPPAKENAQ